MSPIAPIDPVGPTEGKDSRSGADVLEDVDGLETTTKQHGGLQVPPGIQAMSADERKIKERAMVRKIDLR